MWQKLQKTTLYDNVPYVYQPIKNRCILKRREKEAEWTKKGYKDFRKEN